MTLRSSRISILLAAATMAACGAKEPPVEPSKTAAAPPGPIVPATCLGGMNTPSVTINQFTVTGPTTATVNVVPPEKSIRKTAGGILWKFAGNNQSFTVDGITFKAGSASGPGQPGFGNDPSEFVVCFGDTSSSPATSWKYNIKFYDNATPTTVWVCDPTIVNSEPITTQATPAPVTCNKAP